MTVERVSDQVVTISIRLFGHDAFPVSCYIQIDFSFPIRFKYFFHSSSSFCPFCDLIIALSIAIS